MRLLIFVMVAACGGSGAATPDADPFAPDADPFAPDADPLAPDAGPGSPDAAVPAISSCVFTCGSVNDCDFGNPVNDPDNYACTGGACVYQGCNSTQECIDTFMSTAYACGTVSGISLPSCLQTCGGSADCATANVAYDADNYRCTSGLCEYTGCNSEQECATGIGANYGCHQFAGWSYPTCVPRCGTAADCAIANGGTLYDADNYVCDGGYCRWDGCNSTSECTSSLMNTAYECR
ncbi:MAG TPA: hypothetical protein VML75_13935 [Kofleriaceae bacterium]|nr:hypothetical protein [Kofleriaceae bacterium]